MDTRIWICPKLCGCELNITTEPKLKLNGSVLWPGWGSWDIDIDENGRRVCYGFPNGPCIVDIQILYVCAEHNHFRTDAPITDQTYGGEMKGYLESYNVATRERTYRTPITEAEKLFVALTRYSNAQRLKPDTCDCRIYNCIDRVSKEQFFIRHNKHTRKCDDHQTDDDEHTTARGDCKLKNDVLGILRKDSSLTNPVLDQRGNVILDTFHFKPEMEPTWSFDEHRNLRVQLPNTVLTKSVLTATIAGELKTNRVIIE